MKIIRDLRRAAETIPDAAESVDMAADRLADTVSQATTAIVVAVLFSSLALIVAGVAIDIARTSRDRV